MAVVRTVEGASERACVRAVEGFDGNGMLELGSGRVWREEGKVEGRWGRAYGRRGE